VCSSLGQLKKWRLLELYPVNLNPSKIQFGKQTSMYIFRLQIRVPQKKKESLLLGWQYMQLTAQKEVSS
jgi:hypothetical protein